MKAALTDEEFVAAWRKWGGATAMAKATGLTDRGIHARRKRLEGKLGISLDSRLQAGGELRDRSHNPAMRELEIGDGFVLVGSDAHYYPGIASAAHRAFVLMCRELKPVCVVMNGDAFDGGAISRWPRIGWDSKPTVIQELEAVRERLTEIEEAGPKNLVWTLGNHDARFETYLASHAPEYQGVRGFHLKDHFPLWTPCWGLRINGNVVVKHRWHNGIHAVYNNTLKAGTSIITGHLHSLKVTPWSDYNGTRYGVDTGTMASPYGPQFVDYTEHNPVNWRSGFVVLRFKGGRLLWPQVVHVIDEAAGLIEWGCETFTV
jgi:hypothetical protein